MEDEKKTVEESKNQDVGKPNSKIDSNRRFECYTESFVNIGEISRQKILSQRKTTREIDEDDGKRVSNFSPREFAWRESSPALCARDYKDPKVVYESGTLRTHIDGKGFRKIKDGVSPAIPARARNDGSGQPIVRVVGMANFIAKKRVHDTPVEINEYLRSKKNNPNGWIAEQVGIPQTQLEHYFRTDNYRAIPDPETYEKLKKELNLDDRYDKQIKEFYEKEIEYESTRRIYDENGIAPTISSTNADKIVRAVLTPNRLEKRQNGRRFKDNEEPSFTLTGQDLHGVMTKPVMNTLTEATGNRAGSSKEYMKSVNNIMESIGQIRRLTPTECELLQSFPVDWTKIGMFDGEVKEISDTQRYKMMGNAVTVNVIEKLVRAIYGL